MAQRIIGVRCAGDRPYMKDLNKHVIPLVATRWYDLGLELLDPKYEKELEIIDTNCPNDIKTCCRRMLSKWLETQSDATWDQLIRAINSIGLNNVASDIEQLLLQGVVSSQVVTCQQRQQTSSDIGTEDQQKMNEFHGELTTPTRVNVISELADRVKMITIATSTAVDEETWPPIQLKKFVPLLLMHYKGNRTLKQSEAKTELIHAGKIDDIAKLSDTQYQGPTIMEYSEQDTLESFEEAFRSSTVTKEIANILAPLEETDSPFILVEGAPGIGKSVLLREIACRWSKGQLLKTFKLAFLLCLRDPNVRKIKSTEELLQLYCQGDERASEIVKASGEYLGRNGGRGVTILLDGFDEFPTDLQKTSFIADILSRQRLPCCGLILSSRPHASEKFRNQANLVVEILGLTEIDRKHFIEQEFEEQPQNSQEVIEYLGQHLCINTLCFVPFNMVVLLHLYKQGISLPKNSAEMYNYFVCLTISRYLAKSGHSLANTYITDIANLPEPCSKVVKQLSKLSLHALDCNKLIFTLDEIKEACPDIESTLNGFGLLQAVQHIGVGGKTMTFNFVHLSIQEFLAAYYVANLPPHEELQLLEQNFWCNNYFNMFSIYVALTKGQKPSFKKFLSIGKASGVISDFWDTTDIFRFYYCLYEAGDEEMCKSIASMKLFSNKRIICYDSLPNNMMCLSLFLTTSFHKEWVELLMGYIQDHGLRTLHQGLNSSVVTITELSLADCGLTSLSSSLVSDIVISCGVKKLALDGNKTIGENVQLYSFLTHPQCKLEALSLYKTELSSTSAVNLFSMLPQNSTLKLLSIEGNNINDDDAYSSIAEALRLDSSLVKLWMRFNPVNTKGIKLMLESLQCNDTLEELRLPRNRAEEIPESREDIKKAVKPLAVEVVRKRESRGCQIKLEVNFDTKFINLY